MVRGRIFLNKSLKRAAKFSRNLKLFGKARGSEISEIFGAGNTNKYLGDFLIEWFFFLE